MAILKETFDPSNAGVLAYGGNELNVDSKVDDPPGVRLGKPAGGGEALGKISGDLLVSNSRKEKTLLILKHDAQIGGFYEFFAQTPGTESDAGMVRLLTLTTRGATFHVPVNVGEIGQGVGRQSNIYSADGRFHLHLQEDGNMVLYDKAQDNKPVWASNSVQPDVPWTPPAPPQPDPSPLPTPQPEPDPLDGYSQFVYKGILYTVKIGDFPTMEGIFKVKLDRSDMEAYESGAMTWGQVIDKFFAKVADDDVSV